MIERRFDVRWNLEATGLARCVPVSSSSSGEGLASSDTREAELSIQARRLVVAGHCPAMSSPGRSTTPWTSTSRCEEAREGRSNSDTSDRSRHENRDRDCRGRSVWSGCWNRQSAGRNAV